MVIDVYCYKILGSIVLVMVMLMVVVMVIKGTIIHLNDPNLFLLGF